MIIPNDSTPVGYRISKEEIAEISPETFRDMQAELASAGNILTEFSDHWEVMPIEFGRRWDVR